MWGATALAYALRSSRKFQSTRPVWGATSSSFHLACSPSSFQSTRPVWGATANKRLCSTASPISIHAPRVGRDMLTSGQMSQAQFISIHAPRVGRDISFGNILLPTVKFQSTRPVWGATIVIFVFTRLDVDFNPRAPCGARLSQSFRVIAELKFQSTRPVWGATLPAGPHAADDDISIHAPRVGRDLDVGCAAGMFLLFQSTRPVWGATPGRPGGGPGAGISIHAPRVGRDHAAVQTGGPAGYFNPRAPCGARPVNMIVEYRSDLFQSTRPVWGATANLTILPRQICTKGTKEFLLGRKTHGKKEK